MRLKKMARGFALSLAAVLAVSGIAPVGMGTVQAADNGPKYDYISPSNKPEFWGTTKITVPEGTAVDYEHDARFRVFVRDNEDFDLTGSIQASADFEIGTELSAGGYTISYSVTDSDNNTVTLDVPVTVEAERTEIQLEKTLYTLPSVKHLNDVGHTRGNNMDRQIVGIVMDAGEDGSIPEIQMRRISGTNDLTVTMRGHNNKLESNATVKGDWMTVQNTAKPLDGFTLATVPFVKTQFDVKGEVVYEVKWDASDERIQALHYYHEGDGDEYQQQFFAEWEADADSFAVIDGASTTGLLPYEDCTKMRPWMVTYHMESLDTMLGFWTTVTEYYDELIGLSYTPDYYWNQNVKTKYFARADGNGAGLAFYSGGDCIGYNDNAGAFWLMVPGWGVYHEFGHGYQGNVGGSDKQVSLGEVAVNVFSYYMDAISEYADVYNFNWIGNIDKKEDEWNRKRKSSDYPLIDSKIGSDTMLYLLVNPLYSTGDYMNAYAYINQYYREVYFTTGQRLQIFDAWTLALGEKYGIDLTPYFESWGYTISDYVKDEMMAKDMDAMYYIRDLVSDDATSADLKEKYGEHGDYDLIRMSDLKKENLNGSVKITFDIPDISYIEGGYLTINNGDEQVARVPVTEKEMTLDLPAGTYKVAPPMSSPAMNFDRFYIVVPADGQNEYTITYTGFEGISNGNDVIIYCRGYWSEDSHPFTVQVIGDEMHFDYQDTYPNSGGTGGSNVFSKLTLVNNEGATVYEQSVNGGWYDTFVDNGVTHVQVPVELGYKLTIYYRNPNDMRFTSQLTGSAVTGYDIPKDTYTRTYVVTEYGLVPEDMLQADPDAGYNMYKDRVKERTDKLLESVGGSLDDPFKANPKLVSKLTSYVQNLKEEDQKEYEDVFDIEKAPEVPNASPVITFGKESYSYKQGEFDLEAFKASEITITDEEDGIIGIDKAEVTSTVVVDEAGDYLVTVSVSDSYGNRAEASVTVTVLTSVSVGDTTVHVPGEEPEPNEDGSVTVPGGSVVETPEGTPDVGLPDGGDVNEDGSVTLPDGGDVEVGDTTVTVPEGGTVTPNEDGTVTVPEDSTVQTPEDTPDVNLPNGGDIDGDGNITTPGGDVGIGDTTVTVPEGGTLTPNDDGTVTVPDGSVVQTPEGTPDIGLPNGGTVDGDGNVTADGDVKVGDSTVTVPEGGTLTPNDDGTVTLPEGSTVVRPDGPDIHLPNGGTIDSDGNIGLNEGDSAVVGDHTVTAPEGGGNLVTNEDGSVTLPGGSVVENENGTVTVPENGAVVGADGTLTMNGSDDGSDNTGNDGTVSGNDSGSDNNNADTVSGNNSGNSNNNTDTVSGNNSGNTNNGNGNTAGNNTGSTNNSGNTNSTGSTNNSGNTATGGTASTSNNTGSSSQESGKETVKTGEETNVLLWICLIGMAASAGAFGIVTYRRKAAKANK